MHTVFIICKEATDYTINTTAFTTIGASTPAKRCKTHNIIIHFQVFPNACIFAAFTTAARISPASSAR